MYDEKCIVDPRERTIMRYDRSGEAEGLDLNGTYRAGDLQSTVFPTFAINVGNLFAVLDEFN